MQTAERQDRPLRIGELADRVGVTPRTIRYYEERGLLGRAAGRSKGSHRVYGESDVVRLEELIRLRDLLGLSLEELTELAEAEEARAGLRDRWADTTSDAERLRIVDAAIPLVARQLELVRARQATLAEFAGQLEAKLASLHARRTDLDGDAASRA
jgi:MerR family transcriptional regulator, repressor of the yfmOP operon